MQQSLADFPSRPLEGDGDRFGDLQQPPSSQQVNKTRTSKVDAIFKAQKAQNNCFEKNLKFLNFFWKMSHSAEKCERGTLWDLLTYIQLQNIKNKSKGDPFETFRNKNSEKSHSSEKKIEKGGPFSLVLFCRLPLK